LGNGHCGAQAGCADRTKTRPGSGSTPESTQFRVKPLIEIELKLSSVFDDIYTGEMK
jgi:hypothetical protein